jgi:peroxiredoxin
MASTAPSDHTPRLQQGALVPLFVLPSTAGGQSGPGALRSKYNMVLAFVDDSPEGGGYMRGLARIYPDIVQRQARLLVVVPLELPIARGLARELGLPYPLLADPQGSTTRRMLGEQTSALCVADRFGQIYYVRTALSGGALPSTHEALDWLDYIQSECPE